MKDLIGMQFKRDVYGPSLWTDTIREVRVIWSVPYPFEGYQIPKITVKGEKHWFPLEEIVVVRGLDFGQKLQKNKQDLHTIIQEEFINRKK